MAMEFFVEFGFHAGFLARGKEFHVRLLFIKQSYERRIDAAMARGAGIWGIVARCHRDDREQHGYCSEMQRIGGGDSS